LWEKKGKTAGDFFSTIGTEQRGHFEFKRRGEETRMRKKRGSAGRRLFSIWEKRKEKKKKKFYSYRERSKPKRKEDIASAARERGAEGTPFYTRGKKENPNPKKKKDPADAGLALYLGGKEKEKNKAVASHP